VLQRLEAAGDHLQSLEEQAKLERQRRDELIVEAYEDHCSIRAIARAARLGDKSHSRVLTIVALADN
jgi:hypothetical protein